MNAVRETVEVAVPVPIVYDQWTQFETFPRFMSMVQKVEQIRPAVTRWFVRIGPLRHEFYAEIYEQHSDSQVCWRSLGRRFRHAGEVSFRSLTPDRTEMTVEMRYELERVPVFGRILQTVTQRVIRSELTRFKRFIERVGDAGEVWRFTIHDGRVQNEEREHASFPGWPNG